jgi:hypothetical protein
MWTRYELFSYGLVVTVALAGLGMLSTLLLG